MKTYIVQRLAIAVLTLFGMSIVIFVLMRLAPGDIVDILFAAAGYVNEDDKKFLMKELGIDRPIWAQYVTWLGAIFTGDLGKSYRYDLPAWQVIRPLVPVTLELALLAGENQTFGGTVFLDGQPLGKLPPFRAIRDGAVEECREFAFTADCRGGIGRLDIDSKCEGVWHELRIARVRAAEVGFFEADQAGPAAIAPRSAEAVASR